MRLLKILKNRATLSRGFSTLEILIAFAIVTLALSAAASVSFGAQSLVLDGELYLGSILRAEEVFEKTFIMSSENADETQTAINFNQIVSAKNKIDDFYNEKIEVLDITPCIKKMLVFEKWLQENTPHSTFFSQVFSYPAFVEKNGEACSDRELFPQDWENYENSSFSAELENITDIDVVDDTVFISADILDTVNVADGSVITHPDLVIFDIKTSNLKISELDVGAGILAFDFADGYVFAVADATTSQFVVIDVRDTAQPALIAKRSLVLVNSEGSYPQGRSIKYFDSKVYIGTKETAGPEFHIFDVTYPANPIEIGFLEITHNINSIAVRDDIAYLATSANSKELIILDVKNPLAISEMGSFNAGNSSPNDKDATSIYLLGNTIYLGRKRGTVTNPEFYMIDVFMPSSPSLLGTSFLGLTGTASNISEIIVSSNIAFLATTDSIKGWFVLDVSVPENIKKISTGTFAHPLSAFDMKNGVIYSVSSSDVLSENKIYEIF
ncbi:hypothetical protein EXS61_00140 [Candidatus Parcubacteria bacterium]|nr:hypothetical protein [Candidatus Parcubacteria bacterium]